MFWATPDVQCQQVNGRVVRHNTTPFSHDLCPHEILFRTKYFKIKISLLSYGQRLFSKWRLSAILNFQKEFKYWSCDCHTFQICCHVPKFVKIGQFLSHVIMLSCNIDITILSARLSVRPSISNIPLSDENGLTYRHIFFHHTVAQLFRGRHKKTTP